VKDVTKYFPEPFRGDFIGDRKFKAVRPFVYHSKIGGTITVPVNFITDGGTIPKIFYPVIGSPWGGRFTRICIIHDYLCVVKTFSRIKTQKIFLEGLNILGVPFWKKPIMYGGVRAWSWLTWDKYGFVIP